MAQSQTLQELLVEILGSDHVYFQPPATVQMKYPCIVYSRDALDQKFAENGPYHTKWRYQVTVIDTRPDNDALDRLAALPLCSFAQHFVADSLNHDVFSLYF